MAPRSSRPLVSVLMPVHDGAVHLHDACTSILEQTLGDLELVVVDDGSTDGSGEVVRELADRRIRLVTTPHRGESSARNRLLREARGELVTWQDADDISARDRLAKQRTALADGVDIVHHDAITMDHLGRMTGYRQASAVAQSQVLQAYLREGSPFIASSFMARASALRGHECREDLPVAANADLLVRLTARATSAHLPEPLLFIRDHPQAASLRATELECFAPVLRLIDEVALDELVPTAFQREWPQDGATVAKAFTALCLQRRGLALPAVQLIDSLDACQDRTAAAVVSSLLALAQNDVDAALRSLGDVPPNAFSAALLGDVLAAAGMANDAAACYRVALLADPTSYDAQVGARATAERLGLTLLADARARLYGAVPR